MCIRKIIYLPAYDVLCGFYIRFCLFAIGDSPLHLALALCTIRKRHSQSKYFVHVCCGTVDFSTASYRLHRDKRQIENALLSNKR